VRALPGEPLHIPAPAVYPVRGSCVYFKTYHDAHATLAAISHFPGHENYAQAWAHRLAEG
ncbi:hypothetical protein SDD30_08625, partial [Moorella naiadis]|uniref:hypothetical protein n=1 Tax=Moorella naiadis (nom. illeg.) TaxID=3093670 RepID=UPI003D9C9907